MGFDKCISPWTYHTLQLPAIKFLHAWPIASPHPSTCHKLLAMYWFFTYPWFAFSQMSYVIGTPSFAPFPDWLISMSKYVKVPYLSCQDSMPFSTILLNGWSPISMPIHLLKNILVASKFCQWWTNLPCMSRSSLMCADISIWLIWIHDYQGIQGLDHMIRSWRKVKTIFKEL